jgi:hypothetical protein
VLRASLVGLPPFPFPERLPPLLRELVREPPPASTWIPTVHLEALRAARRDQIFSTDDALVDAVRVQNQELLGGPFYGILFRMVGVERVIEGARQRWDKLHRGVEFRLETSAAERTAKAYLAYPQGLYSNLGVRCYGAALDAAMRVAGASRARVRVTGYTPSAATLAGSW